jgi:hypothetical protein
MHVTTPVLQDGAELEVHTETKTTIERVERKATTCPQGVAEGNPACTVTRYMANEPVTRTTSTANYGSTPVTYGQFLVMTDSNYEMKLRKLEELSHVCRRANVPRYAGMALVLGGLIAGPMVAKNNATAGQVIAYGGMGAGGASYALGYFSFGGRECNEARGLFREVDMRDRMSDTVYGGARATEMQVLAEQFNARLRGRTSMKMRGDDN